MIIDQILEIKITKKNIHHYSIYFPNIQLKDIITIDVEKHLQKNSNVKLNVKCDICEIERSIKYQAYNKNINSCLDHPIYTCDKCSHIKLKNTNLKKYGVEYYSKTPEYNEKFKSTMVERYGVEHALQSEELKNKARKKNLEKLGFENPFSDSDRIKSIFKERYGVEHPIKVDWIREKINKTNMNNFGFNTPLESKEIRNKGKITRLKKYGNEIPMKSESIRIENSKIANHSNYISYINNGVSIFKCDKKKDHDFYIDNITYHNRTRSGINLCTVCNPIGNSRSIKENELYEFVKSIYSEEVIQSYKDVLEIDIYLSDLKLGFEFNGLYWHSEEYKEKNYHLNKTKYFEEKGIRIIHIWEDDWILKKDIIKSQIKNWLGISNNKIFARKCEVREVNDIKIIKQFLNDNHIQGYVTSIIKVGLYYNNELVSLMTFDQYEGRKKMKDGEWNLSRFCNKLNTNIIGGASKLLKYFIKNYKCSRIISYADRNWSQGNLYYHLGFKSVQITKSDYKYIIDGKRVHKSRFRKNRLETNLTESQYMKSNGFPKIYDCGKIKFEINI